MNADRASRTASCRSVVIAATWPLRREPQLRVETVDLMVSKAAEMSRATSAVAQLIIMLWHAFHRRRSTLYPSHVKAPSQLSGHCGRLTEGDRSWLSYGGVASTCSPPTPSLFVAQRPSTYSQENVGKFFGGGWGKVACWSTKAAISLKRVKIEEVLLWRAYRNSPTLFRTVPHPTPHAPLSLDWRFATPAQNSNGYYLRNG